MTNRYLAINALAALIATSAVSGTMAQEAVESVESAGTGAETSTAPMAETLRNQFREVCESRAVKSPDLAAACDGDNPPAILNDGTRFTNRSFGREVNTLIANLEFIR